MVYPLLLLYLSASSTLSQLLRRHSIRVQCSYNDLFVPGFVLNLFGGCTRSIAAFVSFGQIFTSETFADFLVYFFNAAGLYCTGNFLLPNPFFINELKIDSAQCLKEIIVRNLFGRLDVHALNS